MKLFSFCFSLLLLLCAATANADWKQVGKAEYNWGPFHIYTVSLFTESGNYSSEQRPLMLRIKFAKPVEGKNFAISLFKEMALDKMPADQAESLRKRLIKNFPDFKPDDVLNYIALNDEGYFVLNDTVLDEHFDAPFNHEFIAIWLDSPSSFKQLQPRLLGEKKEAQTETATENATATATATTKAEASTQTADNNSTENRQQTTKTAETEEKGKADNTSVNSSHSASASTKKEKTVEEKPIKADGNDKSASSLSENKSAEIDKKMQPSQPRSSSTQEITKKSADANQASKMKESDMKTQSVSADTKTVNTDTKSTATNTQTDDKNAMNEEKTNTTTDNKKSQKENSDTKQSKVQEQDTEEPIEPAIECDPILPFLKQYHC